MRPPVTRCDEFRGSTTTLANDERSCSVEAPLPFRASQVRPPSVERRSPMPKYPSQPWLFSPVPTQIVFELLGSIATVPIVNVPAESKTLVHDSPSLSDRHTPPDADPNQRVPVTGSLASDDARPAMFPKVQPPKVEGDGPLETQKFCCASVPNLRRACWSLIAARVSRTALSRSAAISSIEVAPARRVERNHSRRSSMRSSSSTLVSMIRGAGVTGVCARAVSVEKRRRVA